MNSVNLIGRTTRELEEIDGSKDVGARFTLAVQVNKDKANFIPCTVFGAVAETMLEYVHKGDLIGIQGRLRDYSYTNKNDVDVYGLEVSVDRCYFCSSPSGAKTSRKPKDDNEDYEDKKEQKGGRRRR